MNWFSSLRLMNSRLKTGREWKCAHLARVEDRQTRVQGWNQKELSLASGLFFGAGGVNSEILYGCVRKGLGMAHVCDADIVSRTNLNRQFFFKKDLWKNKALCLCRNLQKHGHLGTRLIAHPCDSTGVSIEQLKPSFVVCSVDLRIAGTRLVTCGRCFELGIPGVFVALSDDADQGYVFIQRHGQACWACLFRPESSLPDDKVAAAQCPGVPATIDLTKTLAGLACYSIDTLLMQRPINWNYRMLSLSDGQVGAGSLVLARKGCPVCGGDKK